MANQVKSRKPKTHKGTKKRVKLTKNGKRGAKVLLSRSSKNHFRRNNTASNRRDQNVAVEVTGKNLKSIKQALKLT